MDGDRNSQTISIVFIERCDGREMMEDIASDKHTKSN